MLYNEVVGFAPLGQEPIGVVVTLHEEHVAVERHPVEGAKTVGVFEEIGIRKKGTDRIETVRDTIRSTSVEVENMGQAQERPPEKGILPSSAFRKT